MGTITFKQVTLATIVSQIQQLSSVSGSSELAPLSKRQNKEIFNDKCKRIHKRLLFLLLFSPLCMHGVIQVLINAFNFSGVFHSNNYKIFPTGKKCNLQKNEKYEFNFKLEI